MALSQRGGHCDFVAAIDPEGEPEAMPGLFAAGDVTTVPGKQVIIAAGEGAKAAMSAFKYLAGADLGSCPS